jgi:autotransporter family porin
VSLYPALPVTALKFGRTVLDTLHERVGEEEQLRGQMELMPGGYVNGAWGRLIGVRGSMDGANDGIYSHGPSYDYKFGGFQLGMDLFRRQGEGGHRDHAGVYGAIGWAETDVDHFDGTKAGTDHFTGYSAGGYWTHFGANGWYVDGILQGTWYEAEANSKSGQFDLHTDGFGIAASLEGGYPFRVAQVWVIEPQGQLIYQWIELDDARDPAAEVRFRDVQSLVGRVGVRLARTWDLGEPDNLRRLTAWVRPSVWYEFLGDPKTQFSSETGFRSFRADYGGGWFEIKAGVTGQVARNVALYGSVGYSVGFDGDRHAWDGKVGVRVHW